MGKINSYIFKSLALICLFLIPATLPGQRTGTDANIFGHVRSGGQHIPFAAVSVRGTSIGTVTDETGHFQLINLPAGIRTVVVNMVGYKPGKKTVEVNANQTLELNFDLEVDVMELEEVVVSADRSEQKRTDAPVIVNTISPGLFASSQALNLSEGLGFSPGLRMENTCQNCGFLQVRMNGLEGPYSQILVNSRPVLSGLASINGLELIPSNMIERVEVVRGGGSALFGSNAIAGTINIIMKEPDANTYQFDANYGLACVGMEASGGRAPDYTLNFNASNVSDDLKSGISLYGSRRERSLFDANADGFSEIAPLDILAFGARLFHRFGYRDRLSVDFLSIREQRDGGNKQDLPPHERDIAEAFSHNLNVGGISFERFFRDYDMLSLYFSGQVLGRDSYFGARQSLAGYGRTDDQTYNTGMQYKAYLGKSSLVVGMENTGGFLRDRKLGYPDFGNALIINDTLGEVPHTGNTLIADQSLVISAAFIQWELTSGKTKIALGGRIDRYSIRDRSVDLDQPKTGLAFSPRISLKYSILADLQARASYSAGYRAPQIFNTDLHIETSGSRQVVHINDPELKQETSHSLMTSLDFNRLLGSIYTGILVEGFYTRLLDPFLYEIGTPEADGRVIYTRTNAEKGADVTGLNMEFKFRTGGDLTLTSGFTLQTSRYDEPQEFGEERFFRTPDRYGYFVIDWDFRDGFCLSGNGNYTGPMLVPYYGPETDPDNGELKTSDSFLELGIKLKYTLKLNGASMQFYTGVKNLLNAYQDDFDIGIDRDPGYIYGPVTPRMIYIGISFGNALEE